MILSYAGRLLCVAAVMTGLIHLVVESLLWMAAPFVLRMSEPLPARQRERILYALQLVPMAAALFLACAVCVPHYVRTETNHGAEGVGWFCVAGAVVVGIWYGFALACGLAVAARTAIFARSCRRASNQVSLVRAATPILSLPGGAYGVALVGLFRPFILISESLLGEGGLNGAAMEIVLAHEFSHAKHLDNWKLFSLYCLPTLRLTLRNGRTWSELWRGAAEWAADDDAVRGDSARVLVLAETLVAVARRAAHRPHRVCMALECREADLAARIDRLIGLHRNASAGRSWGAVCGVVAGVAGLVGAMVGVMLTSHDLLEHLLHLGQG